MFYADEEIFIECPAVDLILVHLSASSFTDFPDLRVIGGVLHCRAWINSNPEGTIYYTTDYAGNGPAISVASEPRHPFSRRISWYVLEKWISHGKLTYQRRAFRMFKEKLNARVQRPGAS